jgi:RNA polymerase sigma-70 factor (ECF subfamily)
MKLSDAVKAPAPRAFQNMLAEEITSLKNYARKFTKDVEDINDLVQDTLLKAIQYFDKFNTGTSLKAWLFVIMRNTYINSYRKRALIQKVIVLAQDTFCEQEYAETAENGGESRLINTDIMSALRKLPQDQYLTFKMYTDGYKYCEIAEKTGKPIGTVKTKMHNGRIRLKAMLKDYKYA